MYVYSSGVLVTLVMCGQLPEVKVIIVGGGLSGLTTALLLASAVATNIIFKITVIESRQRLGGRIFSSTGFPVETDSYYVAKDLGAAWTWPSHDKNLGELLQQLNISLKPQPSCGSDIYFDASNGQILQKAISGWQQGTYRVKHEIGTYHIIQRLQEQLSHYSKSQEGTSVQIHLEEQVLEISKGTEETVQFEITSDSRSSGPSKYLADVVILAMPPKLAISSIQFTPNVPNPLRNIMYSTPTWMEATMKLVFTFSAAFWRKQGLSGSAFALRSRSSTASPFSQIWENEEEQPLDEKQGEKCTLASLGAFVFPPHSTYLQHKTQKEVLQYTLPHLKVLYGEDAETCLVSFMSHNWSQEVFTSTSTSTSTSHPSTMKGVGHKLLRQPVQLENKEVSTSRCLLLLAGTETEEEHGHMEGAVMSAKRVVAQVQEWCSTLPSRE